MKKKILIIGPSYLPIPAIRGGAIEVLVDYYLQHNSETEKYDITLYSPFFGDIIQTRNYKSVEFRYINKKKLSFKKLFFAIMRRLLKKNIFPNNYCLLIIDDLKNKNELDKYDLIIVENELNSLPTYRKYIKGKIVEHLHNDYLNIETKKGNKILDSCDEVWGVSNFICNRVNEINKKKITRTLYNGIDIKKFSRKVPICEQNLILNKLGYSRKDFIVIYSGRLMKEKGVLELIKGFNMLKKINNIKLLIVGAGPSEKKSNYEKKIYKEAKKNRSIKFYGKASQDELIKLYSIAKLQVVPSLWEEAFGLIVVEGMCAKNQLIISNSGGMPEIVKDNALIVNRGNNFVYELSNTIKYVYENQKIMKEKIRKYDKIIKKYSLEKYNLTFDEYIEL